MGHPVVYCFCHVIWHSSLLQCRLSEKGGRDPELAGQMHSEHRHIHRRRGAKWRRWRRTCEGVLPRPGGWHQEFSGVKGRLEKCHKCIKYAHYTNLLLTCIHRWRKKLFWSWRWMRARRWKRLRQPTTASHRRQPVIQNLGGQTLSAWTKNACRKIFQFNEARK